MQSSSFTCSTNYSDERIFHQFHTDRDIMQHVIIIPDLTGTPAQSIIYQRELLLGSGDLYLEGTVSQTQSCIQKIGMSKVSVPQTRFPPSITHTDLSRRINGA